ncbi:uncharacterized protein [Epargyreus clarus]|uniref:uncharacterized protein isoform X2 n=1 Tax=Epargyreus clarus TaxID=520877 RepID=UPI003C2CB9EE
MVNYKRVVCEVAVLAVLATVVAAAPTPDCHDSHYDQRQNGTENYRVNIDGIVIAVAPAESFLAAASAIDFGDLLEEFNEVQKPKPPSVSSPSKPEISKPDADKPDAEKPDTVKPDAVKPQESKPETPEKPEAPLSDVTLVPETKGQKKDFGRKQIEDTSRQRVSPPTEKSEHT